MSAFTVVIIIWAIYQLIASVIKKSGMQQTPGKLPDSLKLPEGSSITDVIQGISRGTWREQLKQALENGPYQAGPLESTKSEDFKQVKDYNAEVEGTQGIEGIPGTEGTTEYVGILGAEAYKSTEIPSERMVSNASALSGIQLSLTERELVQGVIWAQILGKPRAMHPFRGPRT